MLTPALRAAAALAALALISNPARAQWALDGVPVCSTVGAQHTVVTTSDGAGGAILVWWDERAGGSPDLYAQRVDAHGRRLWFPAEGVAVCTAAGFQTHPVIVSDGAGGAIIAWADARVVANSDIYAQRLNAAGAAMWTANGVAVSTATNLQQLPTMVADGAGGAIIAWQDNRGGTAYNIYAQRIDGAGVAQWTANGVALAIGAVDQLAPAIAPNHLGGAIIAWTDMRNGVDSDIYFRAISSTGVPQATNGGVPVCTAAGHQQSVAIASDGEVGAIVAWQDRRNGSNFDVHAAHLTGSGQQAWGANGRAVCTAAGDQSDVRVVHDEVDGAIIVWTDARSGPTDVYAQRMSRAGAPQWIANGVRAGGATDDQSEPGVVADGAGGAILAWRDARSGASHDVYAQRLSALGQPLWTPNGVALCTIAGDQTDPVLAADGAGPAIVAWADARSGQSDVYAQRVEPRYGEWGHPEPIATSAADHAPDQGGAVVLRWDASERDVPWNPLIGHYSVWRSLDAAALARAARAGVPVLDDPAAIGGGPFGRAIWRTSDHGVASHWEWVLDQSATYQSAYGALTPTRRDSVAGDPATHEFKVLAHQSSGGSQRIWESNVVTGRSVDDLAPAAPLALTAVRTAQGVRLAWQPAGDPDLRDYAIYRAGAPGVTPTPVHLVGAAPDTGAIDAGAPASSLHYIVTAFDVHGNQSAPSNEASVPAASTDVDDRATPLALALGPARPNPFAGATELRLGLPRRADVTVTVLDLGGRAVRTLGRLDLGPGWHAIALAARDDAGRPLASGVYVCRVAAGADRVERKLVVTR